MILKTRRLTTIFCISVVLITVVFHVAKAASPLLLSKDIKNGDLSSARRKSKVGSITALEVPPSYAGYITVNDALKNHMFFWYFPSMNDKTPLLIWMNGPAGTSGMVGLLWEHGPLDLDKSILGKPKFRRRLTTTWLGMFSPVYIDAPTGTGYSFSEKDDAGVPLNAILYTEELFSFVTQFVKLFPERAENGIYIGGNDFGAKMAIFLANRMISSGQFTSSFKGLVLEAPLLFPQMQQLSFHEYIFSMGYESMTERTKHELAINQMHQGIAQGQAVTGSQVSTIIAPDDSSFEQFQNYATHETVDFEDIKKLMTSRETRRLLHVGDQPYEAFNTKIGDFLGTDSQTPVINEFAILLAYSKYKVLMYSGDDDAYLGVGGVEKSLLSHQWAVTSGYSAAPRKSWMMPTWSTALLEKDEVGYYFKVGPLCRVVFKATGHYSVHEHPNRSHRMIEDFLKHGCIKE